jgi:hypothetical protein
MKNIIMAEENVDDNGNVILIDPNTININNNIVNGIPQYENMYIFAELTAKSKERTVIIDNNVSSTKSKPPINFIGNNQDNETNDPNHLNFTTNYYDGSNPDGQHYEGFGINNIKITINSSFIPQVNIQFIDIRGLAFFNQTDSPYQMLFDFPPPIFKLTVKGYYGKPIAYDLHLVKYTSEFNAANGNFVIDAQFVALTFAPLTDILFGYVVNTSLIDNNDDGNNSMNPEPKEIPKNTFQLILQLKSLYSATSDLLKTEQENNDIKNNLDIIKSINSVMEMLNPSNIKNNEILNKNESYLVMVDTNHVKNQDNTQNSILSDNDITEINDLSVINNRIKNQESNGIETLSSTKLFILYVAGTNKTISENKPKESFWEFTTEDNSLFETPLLEYRKILLNQNVLLDNISDSDIGKPESFYNIKDFRDNNSKTNTKYYGIDITTYYTKLYKQKDKLEIKNRNIAIELTTKINALTLEKLGMTPSIYNIFKIILDDVDKFFFTLNSTVTTADESHNISSNKRIILADSSYNEDKENNPHIYPFPLIVNTTAGRQSRVAPLELSRKVPFPELNLVDKFIDAFSDQITFTQQYFARDDKNEDNVNNWIPISPYDSTLGGASSKSPYLEITDNIHDEVLKKLVERFYVLSQGTLTESFYPINDEYISLASANIDLYSEAEAINLMSFITEKNIGLFTDMVNKYSKSINNLYTAMGKINTDYGTIYDFSDEPESFQIGDGDVYVDKKNPNFKGVNLEVNNISYQGDTSSETSINTWLNTFGTDAWYTKYLKLNDIQYYFKYTTENLIYILDVTNVVTDSFLSKDRDENVIGGVQTYSRYLAEGEYLSYYSEREKYAYPDPKFDFSTKNTDFPGTGTDSERQTIARDLGNISFKQLDENNVFDYGNNIITIWATIFGKLDNEIIDTIIGSTTQNLSRLLILSNFGYTISPFNVYKNSLNSQIFNNAAVFQVPAFYSPYIGALLTAIEDGWDDDIFEYFTTKTGSKFENRGFYVLADLHDVNKYLSDYDKEQFKLIYNRYKNNIHNGIVLSIKDMYDAVNVTNKRKYIDSKDIEGLTKMKEIQYNSKISIYLYLLDSNIGNKYDEYNYIGNKGIYFNPILSNLIERKNIINFSEQTFKMVETYPTNYSSIKSLNEENSVYEKYNEKYFKNFFLNLKKNLNEIQDEIDNKNDELKRIKGNDHIINQLYYSFKNINDKWLYNQSNSDKKYPFNYKNKNLIDSFAFVDRGMNPIGETIINCEILTEMLEDPNISLFSVLSQLLSLNGFEFFPLQNFLNFETKNSWVDSFKIHDGGYDDIQNTHFVCMYVGGSSSYPSISNNGFQNDGIIDISKPNISGFSRNTDEESYTENVNQVKKNDNFPWSQVRAFRVRFGEQNQSMFTDIKIDSKEYPETNESIQILSRLASDNSPDAKVPIGQNLYNLYENRSYKATVTGLGNVMIQPTQYFQLENIPLFNGAYIILNVEHDITPNKMITSFSGTKLLEYPIPRVLEANALSRYNGLSGADAATLAFEQSQITVSNNVQTHYLAMYPNNFDDKNEITLKI